MKAATSSRYMLSLHALQRVTEMGLDRPTVLAAIRDADTDYPGRPGRYGESRRVATHEDLAVVYEPTDDLVITVLWNRKDHR